MKAHETKPNQRIRWTKNGRPFEGVVRAFDESELVIGVIDDPGRCQIIFHETEVEVVGD